MGCINWIYNRNQGVHPAGMGCMYRQGVYIIVVYLFSSFRRALYPPAVLLAPVSAGLGVLCHMGGCRAEALTAGGASGTCK